MGKGLLCRGLPATVFVIVLFVTGCSGKKDSSGAVHLKLANVTSDSAVLAGDEFKRIAEAEAEGTLVIDHFPKNQLGNDLPAVEGAIVGDIDIAVSSTSSISELYRDLYLFDAPFLFLTSEDAYKRLDGPAGKKILEGLASIGLKGLTQWENGFRNFTNNKIPVRLPGDVKGMKVRTMSNDVHLAAWQAFGANPTPMAFNELFTALQQGTVDAEENPLGIIDSNNFQSIQRFVSLTQHVYTPYIMVMNLEKYNSLTDVQKRAIDKAVAESTVFQRKKSQELEKNTLEKFTKEGVTVIELTPDEKAAWQNIVAGSNIFDLVKKKLDHPEYVDEILK
ncbi:MAG: DctP family TRAP transporter solute-binding subunit [Spirochaetaceae bacterium]|jgi:tripartite ATP-independent transporter DctP family solute receptor|nr:DctP family TRAP transporter solute-binding subunit [Spirochaetaceae bacterium]